jgi:hypothetical protein
MTVADYNLRAVAALEKAQALSGTRSANGFARLLAQHVSGKPSESTYRRWLAGEAVVPAWAVEAAAEVAGTTVGVLFADEPLDIDTWRAQIEDTVARLQAEIADLRGVVERYVDTPTR